VLPPRCAGLYGLKPTSGLVSNSRILNLRSVVIWYSPLVSNDITSAVTIAYRTTTAKPRFRQLSPRVAHHRTPKNGNARSFGLIAIRTPKIAEIHLLRHCRDRDVMFGRRDMEHKATEVYRYYTSLRDSLSDSRLKSLKSFRSIPPCLSLCIDSATRPVPTSATFSYVPDSTFDAGPSLPINRHLRPRSPVVGVGRRALSLVGVAVTIVN